MAVDMFMKFDSGITGESTDDKHKDWIEILSFSWGASQPVSTASATGGRTAERVNISDVAVMKVVDKASPDLLLSCCNGKHFKKVTIEICEASESKHKYLEYQLEDVLVSSYQLSGSGGGDKPAESLSLNFGKVNWTYTPLNHDGSPGNKVGPMGWDLTKNVKV